TERRRGTAPTTGWKSSPFRLLSAFRKGGRLAPRRAESERSPEQGATGMRVLVTGGTGFTGSALVRRLIADGHSVVALDYKEGIATQELRENGAEVLIGSVTDKEAVRAAMRGAEVVHHLAAAF